MSKMTDSELIFYSLMRILVKQGILKINKNEVEMAEELQKRSGRIIKS